MKEFKLEHGKYLPDEISSKFNTLDGLDVAKWLESIGYTVVKFYDTGRNGLAITSDNWHVSTNGYVHKNGDTA